MQLIKIRLHLKTLLLHFITRVINLMVNCYFYTIGNVKYNQDNLKYIKLHKIQSKLNAFCEKIYKKKFYDSMMILNSIVTIIIYYCVIKLVGQKILSSYIFNIVVYFITLPFSYKIGKRQQINSCIKKNNHFKHQCYQGYEIYHYTTISEQYIYYILTKLKFKNN